MSDMAMEGVALQGPALRQVTEAIEASRRDERDRRIRRLVTVAGGWAAAGMMTVVAGGALAMMATRPVPKDVLHVGLVHEDGSYEPPLAREDLSQSRRNILFVYTVTEYIRARENYTWEGINAQFLKAANMSAPAERERYRAIMLDKKNPRNPEVVYGNTVDAAVAEVRDIRVKPNPASPYTVDATFELQITSPSRPKKIVRKTARMVWADAQDTIPITVQQRYDPAGIAFTHYTLDDDLPEQPK